MYFAIASAQLKISADKHFLRTNDDKPFFWLGDTGWDLFHLLNREDATLYLEDRAKKGFNLVQAVLLAEGGDGLDGNAYGNQPLLNNNPATPNESFFQHVDFIVDKAAQLGIIMGILPSWGDKWMFSNGTTGIFNQQNAEAYGLYLGRRYKDKPIVWILGGDRMPISEDQYNFFRALASGLKTGAEGHHLITYHPNVVLASDFFGQENWLDINMAQTGRGIHLYHYPIKPHRKPANRFLHALT